MESDETPEGMVRCEWCLGDFLPEDMDGDHCFDCAQEIFGDDE